MIGAKVIADSVQPDGVRLTTMEVTFHRFILAELNTHRRLSRNSASSRAIPLEKMLQRAADTPAIPVVWPCEQPGMSGGTELTGDALLEAHDLLADIRDATTALLQEYIETHPDKSKRLHKSLLNRPLEWFLPHTAIISSTEWRNMFKQRITPSAQPEFHALAKAMRDALETSMPKLVKYGDWHLPYADDVSHLPIKEQVKISTARCARVSYMNHNGVRDYHEDIRMHDETLWSNGHWSPMEHPAIAVSEDAPIPPSNFEAGWAQYRTFAERNTVDHAFKLADIYSY